VKVGLLLLILNALIIFALIYRIERPKNHRHRITGRGGDFE
jgi:hypothetical protein